MKSEKKNSSELPLKDSMPIVAKSGRWFLEKTFKLKEPLQNHHSTAICVECKIPVTKAVYDGSISKASSVLKLLAAAYGEALSKKYNYPWIMQNNKPALFISEMHYIIPIDEVTHRFNGQGMSLIELFKNPQCDYTHLRGHINRNNQN